MNTENDMSLTMNSAELYREETFTDQKVGTLRRMTPVDAEGNTDPRRSVIYIGQAQMMTPAGALPLSFEIPAATLAEACTQFGDAARKAMEETIEELKEMRRQQASSLVIPGQGSPGGMGGMGGMGGKIQF